MHRDVRLHEPEELRRHAEHLLKSIDRRQRGVLRVDRSPRPRIVVILGAAGTRLVVRVAEVRQRGR